MDADNNAAVVDGAARGAAGAAVGRPTNGVGADVTAADDGAAVGRPTDGVDADVNAADVDGAAQGAAVGNHAAHRREGVVLLSGPQLGSRRQ